MSAGRTARHGVTLVEVLLVIGLFALLLAIAFPALGSARAAGHTGKCQSNLRQMSMAAAAYLGVFGRLPAAIRYQAGATGIETIAWDWQQGPGGIRPGPLWSFTDNPGAVQQCPACVAQSTFGSDPFTGYNYNTSYLGGEAPFPGAPSQCGWHAVRWGVGASQWQRSSSTALFGDGGWRSGANKFMRAPSGSVEGDLATVYAGGQAHRHQGATNVAYLDLHVGASRDCARGAMATETLLQQVMGHPANGFLSDDDSAYDPR